MKTSQQVKAEIFNDFREAAKAGEAATGKFAVARRIMAFARDLELQPFPLTEVIQKDSSRIKGWKTFMVLLGSQDKGFGSLTDFWDHVENSMPQIQAHLALLSGLQNKSPEIVRGYVVELHKRLQDPNTTAEEITRIYAITEDLGVSEWLADWYDYTEDEFYYLELLAAHPNCPGWIIDENISDWNLEWIYAKVATNPNLTELQLKTMIEELYFAYSPENRDPDLSFDEFDAALKIHPQFSEELKALFKAKAGFDLT
jgi:hypothetical protein